MIQQQTTEITKTEVSKHVNKEKNNEWIICTGTRGFTFHACVLIFLAYLA